MKKYLKMKAAIVILMLALVPVMANYGYAGNQNSRGPQGGPPPEAIAACEGKNVGDTTSFKGRKGEKLEATCKEIEGQLAAVPDNAPPKK